MDFWTHLLNIISHKVDVILHQISSFAIAGNFKMTAHIALVEHFSNRSRCVQIKIVFFNFQIDSWVRVYWKENNENTYYNHLGRTKIFSIKNSIRKQTLMRYWRSCYHCLFICESFLAVVSIIFRLILTVLSRLVIAIWFCFSIFIVDFSAISCVDRFEWLSILRVCVCVFGAKRTR